MRENVIEFVRDKKTATVTFTQGRFKTKIHRLAKERPEECKIIAENEDGSLCAHVPVSWIKITPTRLFTDEQRRAMSERAAERFGWKRGGSMRL